MSAILELFDGAAGAPHLQLLDALRADGPTGLAMALGDVSELLVECAVDPEQMFTPGVRDAGDFSAALGAIQDLSAALQALEARAVVGLLESMSRDRRAEATARAAQETASAPSEEVLAEQAERAAAREYSMRTRRSPAGARSSLATCTRLVRDMPRMLVALARGHVTGQVARSAAASTAPLTGRQRKHVDRILEERLPDLDAAGAARWGREVAAAIAVADPHGEEGRHLRARRNRHVTVRRREHGMATLSVHLSALDAIAIGKRLSLEAEQLRAHGDRRGHPQIQADLLVGTLLGRDEAMDPVRLDIGLIITDHALFSPRRGDIAHLEGDGVIPAEAVREELREPLSALARDFDAVLGEHAADAELQLRTIYEHPVVGELVAVESHSRAFPAGLARLIRWRDLTCRGPFCDAPIRQMDHIDPVSAGGETTLENGQGLCAWCNDTENQASMVERVAELDGHRVEGHRVEWTSPLGTTRITSPESYGRRRAA